MALCYSKSSTLYSFSTIALLFLNPIRLAFFLFLLFPLANSISFNFSSFNANDQTVLYEGDASSTNGTIQVTTNLSGSVGRALYSQPIHLWDNETGILADFNTHFSFIISASDNNTLGDGLTFFLSPLNATTVPTYTGEGYLGLFDNSTAFDMDNKNQIVAVEFDTFVNPWDPTINHVGIDVNSIQSANYLLWDTRMANNELANAWVRYDSTTTTLSVYLTYEDNPVFQGNYSLSCQVDLSEVLPEWVNVGFSAATSYTEIHRIVSWTFNSTLRGPYDPYPGGPVGSPPGSPPFYSTPEGSPSTALLMVISLALSIGALSCGFGLYWFIKGKNICLQGKKIVLRGKEIVLQGKEIVLQGKKIVLQGKNDQAGPDASIVDDSFEKGTGPRRFTFQELSHATDHFADGGKLGQGGFGSVYKGVLSDTKAEIAVKRISKGSKQGIKEYVSEVKIISRLRHRNLVQLIGWCHEQGDFLLIYEFMPNGSLDKHLLDGKSKLTWAVKYKIALGLASAVLYLHEEWEQCVIHRDIKSSNIMLDSNYNAKLGDFGLARLVDHEVDLQTTILAGTIGYLAPECFSTGKANKESDVYSFGVVALEIACGRKPIVIRNPGDHTRLSEWVWSLYEKGQLFEAINKDLTMEYDELQAERLILVGLWCCHPNHNLRPSIRQAINVLTLEASLPVLPLQMPVAVFSVPICMFSGSSSDVTTDSNKDRTQC